ncbi:hypothetical protein LDENG_00236000 [Lucifuga dentata]|nr:hypothetical protein LDENG_00236000 [Lucifuga dentata]
MKKENSHSILQRHAIPSSLQIIGQNFILQQDNDPKHSSKLCQNYIHSKEVLRIKTWPPQSPDLSPMDLAWDELDLKVQSKHPGNEKELLEFLKSTWESLPGIDFQKLQQRMPRICVAVIKARGGYFDETKV